MPTNLLAPSTGLSNSKLESANAQASHVLAGKTFYAGDKNLKTGTMVNQPNGNQCPIGSTYDGEFCYLYLPIGAYVTPSDKGFPFIKRRLVEIVDEAGKTLVDNGQCKQLQQTNIRSDDPFSGTYSGYQFYVVVSYAGHWNSSTSFSVSTSGCSCIINTIPVSTDYDDSLRRWLGGIQIFKSNNRNSSVSFTITPNNGNHYGGAVYTVYGIG